MGRSLGRGRFVDDPPLKRPIASEFPSRALAVSLTRPLFLSVRTGTFVAEIRAIRGSIP